MNVLNTHINGCQDTLTAKIQRLPGNEDLPLPSYQSEYAAGMDLHAAISPSNQSESNPTPSSQSRVVLQWLYLWDMKPKSDHDRG